MSKDCDCNWTVPGLFGAFIGAAIAINVPIAASYFDGHIHYDSDNRRLCLQEQAS